MKTDNPFAFLAGGKPATLHRLLEKLPLADAAMVLVNLPPILTAQVMAYFPDDAQGRFLPAMREARRAGTEEKEQTVAKLRSLAGQAAPNPDAAPPQPKRNHGPASAFGKSAYAKPQPWKPRTTDETPINAPASPNRPPPVAGDPAKSPLGKLNILELFGLGGGKAAEKKPPAEPSGIAPPAANSLQALLARMKRDGKREPREGVASGKDLKTLSTPRVLGIGKQPPVQPAKSPPPPSRKSPPADEKPAGGARRVDGMAILAAIMRRAGPDVRHNIQSESPELFRQLKARMFSFDDLLYSEDEALAQIFTVAPLADASLALRFAPPALRERALRAVSPRRAELLREDAVAGQARRSGLDDIENAQRHVLEVALRLQSAGRILIDPDDPDIAF